MPTHSAVFYLGRDGSADGGPAAVRISTLDQQIVRIVQQISVVRIGRGQAGLLQLAIVRAPHLHVLPRGVPDLHMWRGSAPDAPPSTSTSSTSRGCVCQADGCVGDEQHPRHTGRGGAASMGARVQHAYLSGLMLCCKDCCSDLNCGFKFSLVAIFHWSLLGAIRRNCE